jgi:hypothetical protein
VGDTGSIVFFYLMETMLSLRDLRVKKLTAAALFR